MNMTSFRDLIINNYLGFYNKCELTKVFIRDKSKSRILTFFTLFEFKEDFIDNPDTQNLTDKLMDIDDNHSVGIIKKELSLEKSMEFFNKLSQGTIDEEIYGIHVNGLKLRLVGEQFVLKDSSRLNDILRFNDSGSYIFEFFEEDKSELDFILEDEDVFNNLNNIVKDVTMFDFEFTKDRIGNYIFQLPVTLLSIDESFDTEELMIDFVWNSKLDGNYPSCYITISSTADNIYTTNHFVKYNQMDTQTICLGRKYENLVLSIWLENEEILLLRKEIPLFLEFDFEAKAIIAFRTVIKNDKSIKIPLEYVEQGKIKQTKFKQIIESTNEEIKEKQLKKEFAFHICNKEHDNSKRFDELIYLINEYGQNGVYIWDLYLNAQDLLDTVFHLKYYDVPVKAITSKKILEQMGSEDAENRSIEDVIEFNRSILVDSDLNGLNLEFRIELGKPSFHDRFLIFPPNPEVSEQARVYSLGSSINGFKKSTHVIQMVSVPNDILNSFNDLWDKLDDESHRIW